LKKEEEKRKIFCWLFVPNRKKLVKMHNKIKKYTAKSG